MREIDPGHIYMLKQLGSDEEIEIRCPKRSGGAVQYSEEWPGPPNQEFFRMLIKRTLYLNDIIECVESGDAVWHLRMALWNFEARAWRRKQEGLNRKKPEHDDSARVKAWRDEQMADDVPFGLINYVVVDAVGRYINIEDLPIGEDRHITKDVIDCIDHSSM